MNRFLDKVRAMKLGNLLILAVAVTLVPIFIAGTATIIGVKSVGSNTAELHQNAIILQSLGEIRYKFQQYRNDIYQLLYLQDRGKIDDCRKVDAGINTLVGQLQKDGISPKTVTDLEAKRSAYMAVANPIIDNYTNKGFVLAQIPKAVALQQDYISALDALNNSLRTNENNELANVENAESGLIKIIIFSIVLSIIIVTAIVLAIQRGMVRTVRGSLSKLSDMSQKLSSSSQELSSNATEMGHATSQIASAISQVATGAADQSSSAGDAESLVEQISSVIDQVATGAQAQAESVNETASSVDQLIGAIQKVSESTNRVAEVVDASSNIADRGRGAVKETVNGMQKIKDTVLDSASKIQTLGEKSKQIGEIIEVIDDIAEQTNLLALNAAIEAARAGEHGKGFAVVADEVRKLAERSARATGEIAELIKGIQAETMQAVDAMERGTQEVETGSELAVNAGSAIEDMMNSIKQVISQIAVVSDNTDQMAFASKQVSQLIGQIAAISQENSAAAEEVAASTNSLVDSVGSIAASAEESAASAEQVSANSQEQAASVQEIAAKVQTLAGMSEELDRLIASFNI